MTASFVTSFSFRNAQISQSAFIYASAKHILTCLQVQHIIEEYTDGYILNAMLTIPEGINSQSAGHTVLNDPQKEAVPL